MARPIKLIREDLLKDLYKRHTYGVKYNTLINIYEIELTSPTLKKILRYYRLLDKSTGEIKRNVRASLFPQWLTEPVQSHNPSEWRYEGLMPFGKWVQIKPNK